MPLPRFLPGCTKPNIDEIIRIDHAGEFGAKWIYQGQLDATKDPDTYQEIKHMQDQELVHLQYFENEIKKRKTRPTLFIPIWKQLGYLMGAVTGKMGRQAAMACTVAVEDVIQEHYSEQLQKLEGTEPELREKIAKFREEELEHRDHGLESGAEEVFAYKYLYNSIQLCCRFAIAVSKRL